MKKPHRIIRTTVGEYLMSKEPYDGIGVYVFACYPSLECLYIGKSKYIYDRIRHHFKDQDEPLSMFIKSIMEDSIRFRLDILVPESQNDLDWIDEAERKLILHFQPQFNTRGIVRPDYQWD